MPVTFVNAEQLSGLTQSPCCQDERRALNTTQQGPVSTLDALQQHGVNGLSWQILQCKEMLRGRNEYSVYTDDGTQKGLFQGRSLESLQPVGSYGMTNLCLQNLTSCCILFTL